MGYDKKIGCCGLLFAACFNGYAQQDSTGVKIDTAVSFPAHLPEKEEQQQQVYHINAAVDVPLTAVTTGWALYAFTKIYSKDDSSPEQISNLKKSDIPSFDRWAVRPYSENIDNISYVPFYTAIPLPLVLLIDKKIRKDALKVMYLYLETMAITGFMYTGSMYLTNRYRPYVYDPESPMDKRLTGNAKNSFYAGHVALVASSFFFLAKVYADYHPESNAKWVFYGLASAVTAGTAYLRYRGGMHFPSDILLGTALGTATGILVPALHKNRSGKDKRLTISPYIGGSSNGLSFVYRF